MKSKSKAYMQAIQAAALLDVDEKRQLVKDLIDILTGLQPESFSAASKIEREIPTLAEQGVSTEEAFAELRQILSNRKSK